MKHNTSFKKFFFFKKRKRGRLDKANKTKREKGRKPKKEDNRPAMAALKITNSLKVETVMT